MHFERIESKGLAHNSYLIGSGKEAIIIDPRRDCDVYVNRASLEGFRITHILETHRNEDYVIGSVELAARTGAEIWHADAQLDYQYGNPARDGQTWTVGDLVIRAIRAPGHTPGSMAYVLHESGGMPWMVFTGDALFAGDVGRVDFLGMDRAPEMASLLYHTLFDRILPLGDGVLICPAHGSGSACGTVIAERPWTTIGLERRLNPKLQFASREAFIEAVAKELERPPYFRRMEETNLRDTQALGRLPQPVPLPPPTFAEAARQAIVLDTRPEMCFGAAHVPGSHFIWLDGIPKFAGWFLPYDQPIILVTESNDTSQAVRYLVRMGYDRVSGFLSGGMHDWLASGMAVQSVTMVSVQELCHRLDSSGEAWVLDVRSTAELEGGGRIPDAHHIHLTQLPHRMDEVPKDRSVYIFCGSAHRATTAASLLKQRGWDNAVVVLGGISGWNSISCPLS